MKNIRMETWLALAVAAVGLALVGLGGLWVYVSATATPIHPNPQDVPSATRATPSPEWTAAVDEGRRIARAALSEQNLPGLSVAVARGGEIAWAEGFGWADLEKRVPVTPDTRFRIGTASIPLTSAAVGLLLEKGRLHLDDVIQKHVPGFPEKQAPVTLRQLMAHVAGIANDGGDEGPLFGQHCTQTVEALPAFADRALRFDPGTQYRYSSFGWILVSAAVEAAANEPFLTFMQRQIFAPLGMDDTLADTSTEPVTDRATSYFPRFAADPRYGPDPMRDIDLSCYAGSSVFLSSPSDLARFAMAINAGTLLQPATVQLLQSSQRLPSGEDTGYGLGWDLESASLSGTAARVIGHDGDVLGGTVASFMTFPDQGLVVSVTSNTSYADTFAIAVKIAEAFAGRSSR